MNNNSSNYNSDSVPLQQFFRRQSDNLNDNRNQHLLHNLYNVMTGYNSTMRIYNENMSRFLTLIDDYRRDIRIFQSHQNMNQYFNSNIPRSNQNTQSVHNTSRISTERIGATQSGTFFQPSTIFSTLFPDITTQFTDVVVRPTQRQINNATRTIIYRDNLSLINTRCPITMEDFVNGDRICMIHHCRHCFRESAIMDWFQTNVRCPVCRYDIRETPNNALPDISHNMVQSENNNTVNMPNTTTSDNAMNLLSMQIRNLLLQSMENQVSMDVSQNNMLSFDIPIIITSRREVIDEEIEDDDDIE